MIEMPPTGNRHRAALRTMQAEREQVRRQFDHSVGNGEDADDLLHELRRLDAAISDTQARVEAVERVEHARKCGEAQKAEVKLRERMKKRLATTEDKAFAFEAAMGPALKAWIDFNDEYKAMDDEAIASGQPRLDSRVHKPHFVWASVMGRHLRDCKQPTAEALRESAEPKTLADWFGRKRGGAFKWLKSKDKS